MEILVKKLFGCAALLTLASTQLALCQTVKPARDKPIATAAEWGPPVDGLRVSLAVEADTVAVTFENVRSNRDMYLQLGGGIGHDRPEFIHLYLFLSNGARRELQYHGGAAGGGGFMPFIVPMMPGSRYSVRTLLRNWGLDAYPGTNPGRVERELSQGASLQAEILASGSVQQQYVTCYPFQIFWSGRAVSNVARH